MTHIEDIVEFQRKFDTKHGWVDDFNQHDSEFFQRLQYAAIALAGEVGEFSNMLKKMLREKNSSGEASPDILTSMREELIDVFIYLVILSMILKVDIGKEYFEKMKKNEERFRNYEK